MRNNLTVHSICESEVAEMKFEWKKQENANRTDKANLKTILRYKVADVEK